MNSWHYVLRNLGLAAGFGASLLLSACSESRPKFNSMDVTGAQWEQTFTLPDLSGKPVSSKDFPGKLTIVFFGFIYCPDACPTHLTKMGEVKKLLGADGEKIQLVFITVDPARDTKEKLAKYLAGFDPNIIGLRGSEAEVEKAAKDFRVFYKKVETKAQSKDPLAYTIDHTTFAYVFDTKGELRLVIPHDLPTDKIANDFKTLLSR